LVFDRKLTFVPYLRYLRTKCLKALNLLPVVAHTSWGGNQQTLLHLYRSCIRSKLDYGCIVKILPCKTPPTVSIQYDGSPSTRVVHSSYPGTMPPTPLSTVHVLETSKVKVCAKCWTGINRNVLRHLYFPDDEYG